MLPALSFYVMELTRTKAFSKAHTAIWVLYILLSVLLGSLHWAFLSTGKLIGFVGSELDARGVALTSLLERLGPTFIKLGQVLSARPDIIGDRVASNFARLQCKVKPMAPEMAVSIVEMSFGKSVNELFETFSERPIACGSIAQVHKAVLKTGQVVAVKIQRPNLLNRIRQDFAILHYLGRLSGRSPKLRKVPINDLILELETAMVSQLDFEQEITCSKRIKLNFKDNVDVYIPEPIVEFSNDVVITMEYIDNLTQNNLVRASDGSKSNLATTGLRMLYKMIFDDGLIHADLHGGNIFFQDGRIVILDFGLTTSLNENMRRNFRDLFFAMATNNGKRCAKIVEETARFLPPEFDSAQFAEEVSRRLGRFSGEAINDFEVAGFVEMLFDVQREFGVIGSTDFTMTIISLLMFEGILKRIDPEMDFQAEAINVLLTRSGSSDTQKQRLSVYEELRENVHSESISH